MISLLKLKAKRAKRLEVRRIIPSIIKRNIDSIGFKIDKMPRPPMTPISNVIAISHCFIEASIAIESLLSKQESILVFK